MRFFAAFGLVMLFYSNAPAQSSHQYVFDQKNQHRWLNEYRNFLSIPNVLDDSINMARNAQFIVDLLRQNGIESELLPSDQPNSAPVVYGEVLTPGATTTLAFYAHYDGQPVNPRQWAEGLEPFKPALMTDRIDKGGKSISFPAEREIIQGGWRLYARGSSDDKAGVFAIIKGYETLLKTGNPP
ncbi:MAG TPA: hypothetical protein VKQ08_09940 [Cyclobacteriaceae bacterium]|nr:hypothetical protein [Cyclobacteriaceae bacterium]